jgi:hypothetical protein
MLTEFQGVFCEPTLAKTEFPSLNLFSVSYQQNQKKKFEVSLKSGVAFMFQSDLQVVTMLFSSITTGVSTFANVTIHT